MPVSLRQVSIMPEDLNGWAMLTSGRPLLARRQRRGHPFDDHVGAAAGDHLRGAMSGPPGLMVTSRSSSS
jgi:hypothetical protein